MMNPLEILKSSRWFDRCWYRTTYPDVAQARMDEEEHYLRVGEPQGWKPCPDFDGKWYLRQYPDVARAGISPLVHFILHGEHEGRMPGPLESPALEEELWRGAADDQTLERLTELTRSDRRREAEHSSFALARWYASDGDWQQVLRSFRPARSRRLFDPPNHAACVLEIEALSRCGRFDEAVERLNELRQKAPDFNDAHLLASNRLYLLAVARAEVDTAVNLETDCERLEHINRCWEPTEMEQLVLNSAGSPLTLENLTVDGVTTSFEEERAAGPDRPLVTVIVPAFNCAGTLATALDSLVAQSLFRAGSGLVEVIVVDDASDDDTAAVAGAYAATHAAIRLIRRTLNEGSYAARNCGLAASLGRFITTHDADDWSYPKKLEMQVRLLLEHPDVMACTSHWARCDDRLVFGHWRIEEGWIYRNVSSLMFRREVFETLGFWDRVRVEADTEYFYRIRAAFGPDSLGEAMPGVPLSFGRVRAESLSRKRETHLATQFRGVRAEYRSASERWYSSARSRTDLFMPRHPTQRLFPAPESILP